MAVVEAFRAPGALERPVTVPFGTVPGEMALHLRIVEVLAHGWDLARATGRTVSFPDDVVEQEIAFSRRALPMIPPERAPFAPSRPVADDARPARPPGRPARPRPAPALSRAARPRAAPALSRRCSAASRSRAEPSLLGREPLPR